MQGTTAKRKGGAVKVRGGKEIRVTLANGDFIGSIRHIGPKRFKCFIPRRNGFGLYYVGEFGTLRRAKVEIMGHHAERMQSI